LGGVVLQVHHKAYVPGRKPWEYAHDECETLCKGCHAQEHGIIMPQSGWEHMGSDDLGGLDGNCELCGTELRYTYLIHHRNWGSMTVGSDCCDRLTGTTEASEFMDLHVKARGKLKRFVSSPRWSERPSGEHTIEQDGISVSVWPQDSSFRLSMDDAKGRTDYDTLIDAKVKVFELIETGEAAKYLEQRRERILERLATKAKGTPALANRRVARH
jgi:hypothetical protein